MGQLVVLGDYTFDADKVISVGPAGTGIGNPPDLSRILVNLDMGEWTATYEFNGNEYSLNTIREAINTHRTPVYTNAKASFVSPEYRSAIGKLDKVIDHKIQRVTLTADEARSVLDVCMQVTPEV